MSKRSGLILLAVFAVFGALVWYGYSCLRGGVEAVATDHAYTTTLNALAICVRERKEWPKGWKELLVFVERVDPDEERAGSVSRRVDVDFSRTVSEIATADVDKFDAVRPHEPNYGPDKADIAELIATARGTINSASPKK